MGPDVWELFEDGGADDEVAAIIRLGHYASLPKGVRLVTQFGEIVTVRTTRANILSISGAPEVVDIAAGNTYLGPDVEISTSDSAEIASETILPTDERRPPDMKATGHGIVIGVVDWGFDFAHPDFRNKDRSTRILALWDQRGSKRPNSPQPFGYGVVHDRDAINRALKEKDPYAALGYHPADADPGFGCHATHVLSIAAGSGGEDRPVGIAPDADLVCVHNAPWDELNTGRLGDSVTLLEGIDFISRTAGDRPWVINLSMGRHGEQHDGTTLIEQGLDAAIRSAAGRAVCLSTGNYFDKRIHAAGQLRPTQERTIVWEIVENKQTNNQIEFWYSWQDRFVVTVKSPDGSINARVGVGDRSKFLVGGKEVGNVYHRGQEPNNLDNHITIYLYKDAPAGEWEITITGEDVIDGRYHAWIERDVSCPSCQSRLRPDDADPHSTTGTICNGKRTMAVGAYNKHDPETRIAHFSSVGPTRDGRLKPDLCAPGVSVLAARSSPRDPQEPPPLLTRMSGTSMAAPHVTGTIALMFQVAPRRLRIEETHNLLLQTARKVSVPEEIPERIGIGFLDIEAAVEAARNVRPTNLNFKQTTFVAPATAAKSKEAEGFAQEAVQTETDAAAVFMEGRADAEFEDVEATPYQNTFHRIASDITSAFEGGKTGTLNLYDLGIISYGKHQATLHSGTLYGILKRFTELSSSATSKKMAAYLDRVKQRDATLREESEFIALLRSAAAEPEMDQAQDEEFARQYWQPAKNRAAKYNVKSALGHAIFYDTTIQGGADQVSKSMAGKLGGIAGQTVNGKEISEFDSLRMFVKERIDRNLRISDYQQKTADKLNQAAQDLEDAAAAAADPAQAAELKKQAAEKSSTAKQFAANSKALQISSTKTRGPSFMELVESGDLNLFDGPTSKIRLKGKPGVEIESLHPGATIDVSSAGELATEAETTQSICCSNTNHRSEGAAMKNDFEALFVPPLAPPDPGKQSQPTLPQGPAQTVRPAWVELADQIVSEMQGSQASVNLLHQMFERSDVLNELRADPSGNLPSAAQIFDSFVRVPNSTLGKALAQNFEVVALPNQPMKDDVRSGDIMVRRFEGPSAHLSVVASSGAMTLDRLHAEGFIAESTVPGQYVQVVDTGASPHESEDRYARQLTDSFGRVLNDIVLLRLATQPPPTVVTINQSSSAKDDLFASTPDESAESATEGASFADNNDYFDMTELPPVVTRHEIKVDGVPLKYTATAGRLPIKSPAGQIEAEMFYVAYTLDGQEAAKRPLTFAFNGGPGSASLWLHMGALGPRKVVLQPDGFLPPAPYRIENNPYTLLDKSDLVFIDAIGTGFSRAANLATFEKFWGVTGDIEAFSEFIRLFITRTERWGSPLFLFGESYGTLRAAGIAGYLSGKGISFNGIALLSTVLNYQTLEATKTNDQPYIFLTPTFTMIAGYHHRLPPDLDKDVNRARQEAEKWATTDYAEALAKGDSLTPAERQEIIDQMARFTGLSKEVIDQANLRIDVSKFTRYLLLDKKLRVGRFDGRFTGTDPGGLLDTHFYDPTEAATHPPFTSVFNNYLRTELGFKTDLPYYTRAQDADSSAWNWGSAIEGFPDTATAIHEAILKNPYLKVLVLEGYYDLATPFSAANYTIDHLELPAQYRRNISFATYEAGHMVYLPQTGLKKMKADVANFVAQSAAPRPSGSGKPGESEAIPAESDVSVLAEATTDMSLKGIADCRLGQLPAEFLAAILTNGENDANDLTNRVFWQRHPEVAGMKLDSNAPSQRALRNDWGMLFRWHVKPLIWLRAMINVLDKYRGTLPREFLLGWMAWESDGDLKSTTPLHELGYFQIMWQGGEAKDQLHMTLEEFPKLETDPDFSIEKGVALAEAYRQHILKNYPSIADGSDLLWRLTKGRHAASGILRTGLRKLQTASIPITWAAMSNVLPSWMLDNIGHTMSYAAKLKPFADLVPLHSARAEGADTAESRAAVMLLDMASGNLVEQSGGACPSAMEEVIRGWGQYKDDVDKLPPPEREKIERLADLIVSSFAVPDCTPLGQITVIGHADKDYHGASLEQRVSDERALSAAASLAKAIMKMWRARGMGPFTKGSIAFDPSPHGVGATQPDPANMPVVTDRTLNRRAVIRIAPRALPGPSTSTTFDELTDFVRTVSMGLTSDPAAKLAPPSGTALRFALTDPHGWDGTLLVDSSGSVASDVKVPAQMGGSVMPMTVFSLLSWRQLTVSGPLTTGNVETQLPLTRPFVIATAQSSGRRSQIIGGRADLFPLDSEIQRFATVVFGYSINDGNIRPLDIRGIETNQLKAWLGNHGASASVSTSRTVVLAVLDFCLCSPADDFQPTFGMKSAAPAKVARTYPLLSVWSSRPEASVKAEIEIVRPGTTMMEEMFHGGAISASFYTDMNTLSKHLWDELDPTVQKALQAAALAGIVFAPLGVSASALIAIAKLAPSPRWDAIFAHYKLSAALKNVTVVSPRFSRRSNASARQVWDRSTAAYGPSTVEKVERQGTFDNVHMAPIMNYKGAAAYMAPICQHDCVHIHWRWGAAYSDRPLMGWSGGKPYQRSGAPLIPENQTLRVSSSAATFRYMPEAEAVAAQEWQMFMHHGTGYVTKLNTAGEFAPMIEATAPGGSISDFASFYYHNRFWETGGASRAADTPRLIESFGALETM